MNRIQAFSMRRQCNLKISLEKNLKTCKEKFQYEMRREKKKKNEVAAVGKFTLSIRRSSCSKDARNCDPRGQKNRQSRAIPLPP